MASGMKNLFIGQLADLGFKIAVQNKTMKVNQGVLVCMKGYKLAINLYMLKVQNLPEGEALLAMSIPSERCAITWHKKLEHMSKLEMKNLAKKNLLRGLTKALLPFCEH